jgi:threonine/homoserine/homoserine lactone efflux protein
MWEFLLAGLFFGITGGLTPGPLMTLVISETLKYGKRAGIKIALAPLLTDTPIVIGILFLIAKVTSISLIAGIISLCGGVFLIYLGMESLRFRVDSLHLSQAVPKSLLKGIITNFLNPSPYIFWFTIGAPIILKASEVHITHAAAFLGSMYFCLVGSKITVALLLDRSRALLSSSLYTWIIRGLGIILLLFAVYFFWEGMIKIL